MIRQKKNKSATWITDFQSKISEQQRSEVGR